MTKRFETPKDWKKFSGSIEIHDPLPLLAVMTWEEAITTARDSEKKTTAGLHYAMLPAIFGCVAAWHIDGLDNPTVENFPGTPRAAASQLVAWIIDCVMDVYRGEELEQADPNE